MMKQQLYKISLIIIVIFSFSSCTLDEEEISTKDLLLGKWQTTSYTENDIVPSNFSRCDLSRTMEFFDNNDITFIDYVLEGDTESDCVFDETYTFKYEIINDNSFTITRPNGLVINVEIVELTTSTLEVKSIFNDSSTIKRETFERKN